MFWGAVSSLDPARYSSRPSTVGERETFRSEATAAGYLFVDLPPPRESLRGRLSLLIDGAIERALDQRGAPPPGDVAPGLALALADQLGRAEVTGATGIALWIAPLSGLTDGDRTLDCADSATLRWWVSARETHRVRLGFDPGNALLSLYLEPVALGAWLGEERSSPHSVTGDVDEPSAKNPAGPVPAVAAGCSAKESSATCDGPDSTPSALAAPEPSSNVSSRHEHEHEHEDDDRDSSAPASGRAGPGAHVPDSMSPASHDSDPSSLMAASARRLADTIGDDDGSGWLKEALLELSTPAPAPAAMASEPPASAVPAVARPAATPIEESADIGDDDDLAAEVPSAPFWDRAPDPTPPPAPLDLRFADDELEAVGLKPAAAPAPAPAPAPEPAVVDSETRARLEGLARELQAANGPKPLGVVERLFATAYAPLRAALDGGADLPRLRHVADEWARSFEKSYTDAFDALRMRSKRPTMVVDVPDVALRVARLHGARSTQLLLVDGMRYDLGQAVNDKLRGLVGQRAACAERFLLWAALPTTTANQIELIGRGPAGLRETPGSVSDELVVARGKKAAMIRRLKAGHRELFKLDVVEARLTEPGGAAPDRREGIADEVAERIALHFEGLPPRTLVMVFGDHGFALEQDGAHPVLRHGSASPEEVLVPAFAWLVGAVH